ncbi:MAG: lysophospholipid transporter LplT [Gammaproteobacteria bacterium]|nr:lysophospholipid transporter LplT [Gammaproteobacteria bacterium]
MHNHTSDNAPTPLQSDTTSLITRGMAAVLFAQFLSALADNALLFGALALLHSEHYPDWASPLLQEFFVVAFIVLAPFVGPLADSISKGRVMLLANGLKFFGALGMLVGINPFVAYGLVGVGAAAYSPAKYGILSELTTPAQLVKANSMMEASTITAILAGAILGGTLADWSVPGTLSGVIGCYLLAAAANLFIPKLPAAHPLRSISLMNILRDFGAAVVLLFKVDDTRFSLIGTSIFWGVGATLRFLLVAWVPMALGVVNNRLPAYLNAMVAVGIVIGAGLAARFVTLQTVTRVLPAGILIGVVVYLLSTVTTVNSAFFVIAWVGLCGGFFVVPLNALLQERGHETVGAGHAIAVQNLVENITMLLMIGAYILATKAGASATKLAAGYGVFISLAVIMLGGVRLVHLFFARKENT